LAQGLAQALAFILVRRFREEGSFLDMGRPSNVLIVCAGTRGDIQPYIALALELQKNGYRVCIASNQNHASFVSDFGIAFKTTWDDSDKMLAENPGLAKALVNGDLMSFVAGLGEEQKKAGPALLQRTEEALEEFKPDLILNGTLSEYQCHLAMEQFQIPFMHVKLQATCRNPDRALFGFPSLPFGLNETAFRILYADANFKNSQEFFDPVCLKRYGFALYRDCVSKKTYYEETCDPVMPVVVGHSPIIARALHPHANDMWEFTGQFVLDADVQKDASKHGTDSFGSAEGQGRIEAFLRAGEAPAYMGWGSMLCKSPEHMVKLAAQAAKRSGLRALVYEGWAKLSFEMLQGSTEDQELLAYAKDNLLFIGSAPHEWLFPQCACVVHHGGAGTLGSSLRSGVPTIVTPVWLDQWDQAHAVNQLGVGVGFEKTQLQEVQGEELGDAMMKAARDSEIRARAQEVGKEMRKEKGCKSAVCAIERFWKEWVETGRLHRHWQQSCSAERDQQLSGESCGQCCIS